MEHRAALHQMEELLHAARRIFPQHEAQVRRSLLQRDTMKTTIAMAIDMILYVCMYVCMYACMEEMRCMVWVTTLL